MESASEQPHIVRCRISHELAFPVGYELLREYFGDLLQWADVSFYFCSHPTTFASEFTQVLRDGVPYRVLRFEYRGPARCSVLSTAGWCFTVYPVRRELKGIARAALAAGAVDVLRDFVSGARTHSHYYKRTDVIFDPAGGTCSTELLYEL